MDLPPLSYHDFLEELWDEGEQTKEIETVINVVPSTYYQYLDVFSKLKEEKRPPHCACDHHADMEGSLPPKVSSTPSGFNHCFNPSPPTIVETDASDYALGAVLSQVFDSGKYPIAFVSCKCLPEELKD
ncbi:hypothetical protein O181_046748 [Austropuccinia psidii MF-1]|uniref:Reverse transcriptase/retrotransposon-derived protein RNase H-like domain-containing protein n=1 Tax=Austropuccinia psidii MF-1 TaxID=1389203 RepID=A0A9Q3DSX9_9BASI|nr:hypothetical protein [Austropuccinia psidii MF-1]